MNVYDEINDARNCGVVHCGMITSESITLAELATQFGLSFTPEKYHEISKLQAESVAKHILYRDLAYDVELMPKSEVQKLTNRFFDCFNEDNTRYYTNGDYYSAKSEHKWNSATAATFDTGILIVSRSKVGCLWVEDED